MIRNHPYQSPLATVTGTTMDITLQEIKGSSIRMNKIQSSITMNLKMKKDVAIILPSDSILH